ncbi:MAG: hypothetical protein JNK87_11890 [Bryobacterales bacterium]|nr:hypothetical protein [Bryobacterales bacterium]
MRKILFVFLTALSLGWAESPQPAEAGIRIAVEEGAGLAEVVPELEIASRLSGDRGCVDGRTACPAQERISGAIGSVQPGSHLRVGVAGEDMVARVSVVFRGQEILVREQEQLPGSFLIPAITGNGRLHVSVETNGKVFEKSVLIGETAEKDGARSAASGTPSIRYFVNVAEEGNWEVITGSGTGGRLVSTRTFCMIPGVAVNLCPWEYRVFGYTDRARRGEPLWILTEGSGTASQIGVTISGRVRNQWFNVPLPVLVPQTVSLSPSADNVYGFVVWNNRYYERRLPIGTRPF